MRLTSVRSIPNKQSTKITKSLLNKHSLDCTSKLTSNQNSCTYQSAEDESLKRSSGVQTCPKSGNQEDKPIIVPDLKGDGKIKENILECTNLLISSKTSEPPNGHKNNVSDNKVLQKAPEHEFNNSENIHLKVDTSDSISKNDSNSRKTVVIWL